MTGLRATICAVLSGWLLAAPGAGLADRPAAAAQVAGNAPEVVVATVPLGDALRAGAALARDCGTFFLFDGEVRCNLVGPLLVRTETTGAWSFQSRASDGTHFAYVAGEVHQSPDATAELSLVCRDGLEPARYFARIVVLGAGWNLAPGRAELHLVGGRKPAAFGARIAAAGDSSAAYLSLVLGPDFHAPRTDRSAVLHAPFWRYAAAALIDGIGASETVRLEIADASGAVFALTFETAGLDGAMILLGEACARDFRQE